MEPCTHKKASHFGHRKREKASKKKAEARKHEEEAFRGNGGFGGFGYYGPFDNGYAYHYPHGYYPYPYQYGWPGGRYPHYDEYVARAPLSYRDGFNHYGCLHFGDTDPYLCYQSFYETPIMPFPQAPPPPQLHPFSTPETVCSIM